MDANGQNFREPIDANNKRKISVKLQPPSWWYLKGIYYAGAPETGFTNICDNSICMLDIPSYVQLAPSSLVVGSDMPVVHYGVLGPTLFYRFDDGAGSRTIRFALLNAVNGMPTFSYPTSNI